MKVFLVLAFLFIIGVLVYFLVKASDECTKLEEQVESLQFKLASAEAAKDFVKSTAKKANSGVANALVNLAAMGPQDEYNKVHLIAAQKDLMEVNEKLENL
jgi:cell division protein FtsB